MIKNTRLGEKNEIKKIEKNAGYWIMVYLINP